MNVYEGVRSEVGVVVTVNGEPLPKTLGDFDWGKECEESRNLAHAMLSWEYQGWPETGKVIIRDVIDYIQPWITDAIDVDSWSLSGEKLKDTVSDALIASIGF